MPSLPNDPYKAPDADLQAPEPTAAAATATNLNPWFSIWTQPRATIQQIIDTDPTRYVLLIAMLTGIGSTLDRANIRSLGDTIGLGQILVIAVIAGPLAGIVFLYLSGALIKVSGAWLGGQATPQHVRAALAWAAVPGLVGLVLWVPQLALFGKDMFTSGSLWVDSSPLQTGLLIAFALAEIVLPVWALVLTVKCVAQVQGFSAWRGLGNIVLAALVILVPLIAIGVLLALVA